MSALLDGSLHSKKKLSQPSPQSNTSDVWRILSGRSQDGSGIGGDEILNETNYPTDKAAYTSPTR